MDRTLAAVSLFMERGMNSTYNCTYKLDYDFTGYRWTLEDSDRDKCLYLKDIIEPFRTV